MAATFLTPDGDRIYLRGVFGKQIATYEVMKEMMVFLLSHNHLFDGAPSFCDHSTADGLSQLSYCKWQGSIGVLQALKYDKNWIILKLIWGKPSWTLCKD